MQLLRISVPGRCISVFSGKRNLACTAVDRLINVLSLDPEIHSDDTGQVRLFVAIPVPDAVRTELRRLQAELKALLPAKAAAWTKPDGMHLTLRFLGNVNSARVSEVSERLGSALVGSVGFDLICERLGCFPDLRFPRVIWAWVHDDAEQLTQFQRRINEAVAAFAEKPADARFVGHVTLARLKQIKRRDAEPLARFVEGAVQRRFGGWRAESVTLIQSQLAPTGATYAELLRVKLL